MSIIENDINGICYVCLRQGPTEVHHMMHGTANRRQADKYGLTVNLCRECHRRVHEGHDGLDKELMQTAQRTFEKYHAHTEWMRVFGKNYL